LRKELGIIVELVDERLTSWAAHQEMAETARATKRDERRTAPETDDLAAAILLRDYLGRERPQKHPTSRGGEK
jgi:RNase H-fold protein (predicted Holliday junction resolvase)